MKQKIEHFFLFNSRLVLGCFIKRVWKLFSIENNYSIPVDIRDQEADGSIFIEFNNNKILCLYANAEEFTIDYEIINNGEIPLKARIVSNNTYWSTRINEKIIDIITICGESSIPYGVMFKLEKGLDIRIMYLSESEYDFDSLIIR